MAARIIAWIIAALYVGMGYVLIERAINGPVMEPASLNPAIVMAGVVVMLAGGMCALIGFMGDDF